jgi:regulatory protein
MYLPRSRRMGSNGRPLTELREVRRGWVLVSSDDVSWLVPVRILNELSVSVGSVVDPKAMDALVMKHQPPSARRDAERYLSQTERTRRQLSDYLLRRLYHGEVVDGLLDWAEKNGLIDDRRYADAYMRSHSGRSPMGNYRIRMELLKRGVSRDVIDDLLQLRDEDDMFHDLVKLVRSRYGGFAGDKGFRRASSYLQRRGFSHDLCRRILAEALKGSKGTED